MREILITQSNVFVLIILVSLAGLVSVTQRDRSNEIFSDTIGDFVAKCTLVDKKTGISKDEYFVKGTDCEAMRTLSKEGKPLPTIIDSTAKPSP